MTDRIHYSQKIIELPLRPVTQRRQGLDWMKPNGFWYSAGDEWEKWCAEEMPGNAGPFAYHVDISKAKVLALESPKAILDFHEEYSCPLYPGGPRWGIEWGRVYDTGDGIEIIPYQWPLRLHSGLLWYYGWDVGSGCIWNVDKISIT